MTDVTRIVNVKRCELCGDDHAELDAWPLPAPFLQGSLFEGNAVSYEWRVECPVTGQTLLLTDGQTWTK